MTFSCNSHSILKEYGYGANKIDDGIDALVIQITE